MGSTVGLGLLILALLVALVWLAARPKRPSAPPDRDSDVDHEMLEEAEDEVADLDGFATPDDAGDHLPDWGPGAPKT